MSAKTPNQKRQSGNASAHSGDSERVVHPAPYNKGSIEVWDFIADQGLDFLEGNVVKYLCRHRYKNGIEDLHKARQYLEKKIAEEEKLHEGTA